MTGMTGAEVICRCLEAEGVKTVFGYPGAAICPFYDQLYKISDKIRHVLVRHEANGGHAASGYGRITGKPGVCIGTSGPGALNLITAIATAYADSIPLVVITGQVPTDQIGRDVFQEADITGSAEPFVKHSYLVRDVRDLPAIMKEAFYLANTGRKGPVLVDIPQDIQEARMPDSDPVTWVYPDTVSLRGYKPSFQGNSMQVKKAAEALLSSRKPLICAGGGVLAADAGKLVETLSNILDAPVVSTMMGLSAVPYSFSRYFGMIGMHGKATSNYAMNNCDLLVLIGARVGDRAVKSPGFLVGNTRIIHIDVDPAEIGKNLRVDTPIVGDCGQILGQLIKRLEDGDVKKDCSMWLEELRGTVKPTKFKEPPHDSIQPKEFINKLAAAAPDNAICVADVGQNQIWSCNFYHTRPGGRFLTSGGMGTMGYSVPAALGASAASIDSGSPRTVFAICGDGSFQMQMAELATMTQHGIPVKVIVMTNGYLGMVRELQTRLYGDRRSGVNLDGSPDFQTLAAAYGIPSRRLTHPMEMDSAIKELLEAKGPFLLECHVDPMETTL